MSEQAVAFGLMGLFLFFVALAVSSLEVGTCAQCDHCRELRRREDEERHAVRVEPDQRRSGSFGEQDELVRRQALMRQQRERASRSRDHGER